MKTILFIFVLLINQAIYTQNKVVCLEYNWEENPEYSVSEGTEDGLIAIKDKYIVEYLYGEDESLSEYYLEHRVLWLNSDEKIEDYNKIYLPHSSSSVLVVNKARVVTKEGKIIELDDSKILTAEDEETGRQYKYFAFEGIEKGSFIEYYYVEKKNPEYTGSRFWLQSSYLKKAVEFDLYSPSNLVFKFKSYNALPEVTEDTLMADKRHWQLHLEQLNGLEDENQSPYDASRGFIVYKLDGNTKNNVKNIVSYRNVTKNLYAYYYAEPTKKIQLAIDQFLADANLDRTATEEQQVRELEMYLKANVFISKSSDSELKDLESVLNNKVANETGIIKLYVALLRALNIKHEMVITSNREKLKFDKDFEANIFLTDFLFYFPETTALLSPTDIQSRYGFPPAYLTDNYGLFIKEVKIGDFKSGVGKIKYIDPIPAQKTQDKMIIDIDFDNSDIANNKIRMDRSLSGYYAMYIHPYLHLVSDKDKEELMDGLAKNMNENVEVLHKEIINGDPQLFGVKPLQFIIELESDAFTEKAGNKYLFKVGELIGQQMEMYQEKERVLPLENEFKRSYYRTLNINIPEGYKIANLEDLNMDNSYGAKDEELMSFKSSYELNDNKLTITADEHYRLNFISTEIYEEYRKVINSAADFNKITLVFEPL